MIIQGTSYRGEMRDQADVVIVGTGSGGGTLGAFLAERGWNVVMVEKGGFFRAEDFTQREEDAMADFNGRRGLDATIDNSVFLNYAEAVGGCTVHYWGDSFRAPEDRLEKWRNERGLDWMTPAELNPHWDIIEQDLGVHIAGPELFNDNNRLIQKGCEALGVEGHAVPTARRGCIACGWTQFGCAYNRKSSQLITTIPRVSKQGGRIYSDAHVRHILIENGKAVGVEGYFVDRKTDAPRSKFRVDAKLVVVASGAIGAAELLLRTLPNESIVGSRFYINPHYFVFADFGKPIDNQNGIPCAYAVHEWRRVRMDEKGRYQGGGYIMLSSHQSPGIMAVLLSEAGAAHTERMKKYHQLGSTMSVIDEDNPGRIYIDDKGYRRTEFRVRGVDQLKAVDYLKNATRIFLAAGAREVWIPDIYGTVIRNEREIDAKIGLKSVQPNAQFTAGSHFLGTAPLGADASDAFAGVTGEAHRVRNLYVADGSAIPTSISVDPSLTIMGVARWIAAGIDEKYGKHGA